MKQIIRKLGIALPLIVGAILFGCWNNGDIVSDEQDESAPRPLVANKPATLIPSARNSPIVVFTIDDGMLSTYTGGFPVFQEFGYPATAFIPTQRVMQNNPRAMSWAQITELRDAGWEIGGHTLDHLHLTTLPDSEAIRQVALDLQNLLDHGFEPVSFAFPFGNYTNREKAIAHNYYRNLRNSHDSHMTVGWSRTDFGYYCYTTGITATSTIRRISSAANLGEGMVIIGLHLFTQTPGEYNCPPDSLRKILTYVQERGLRVMTLQDAADAIGAQ